jgi:hypothetical protein
MIRENLSLIGHEKYSAKHIEVYFRTTASDAEKRGIVHDIFRGNGVEIIHELWGRDDILRALPTSGRSNPSDNAGLQ